MTSPSAGASPRSPFGDRDGAVLDADGTSPLHYGNPIGEQRLLERGRAVVDLGGTGIVTVSGPDRLSWLNSMTSQLLLGLAPGTSTETLVLDASGRVEHAARVVDDGETTWLLTEHGDAEPLAAWLTSMRFMLRVEVADRSADVRVVGSFDPAPITAAGLDDAVIATWIDPWSEVAVGGWSYADAEDHPGRTWTYRETILPLDAATTLGASDVPVAGTLALEALRIAAWRPRLADVDERTIPHELDWLRSAVHLTKGCYRGQETVAKVHNLGHPPRRLVMLHVDGSDGVLPAVGALVHGPGRTVEDDPAEVGRITAVANHHELGPIALAVVKRSLDPATVLTTAADDVTVTAAQQTIVPTDAGATAGVPRMPRLGAVRR
ncbi:CAF17-like 4Fe-4S cluster assembly/insertion protein YgfZ [Curtobacterium sp. Leaf261]|uniref:CAF17-like 4Fe-4S cluster assembly/insertion protein YgfZ n=1 Tax=Curtobacterium sp. Leaf261 TaxID=1736311 RepID=UPI0006FEEFBE|nr:folate-binding protein YgfZ [Curtobacterium sp. Leaf261]KQO63490.1 aminomethyltransferase [Curtobacterium sp. Leaf261]